MNEKQELQKELFEEFSHPGKSGRRGFDITGAKKLHNIALSNEQLIFIFIGLVMLMAVCFSLGVERGKRIVPSPKEQPQVPVKEEAVRTAAPQPYKKASSSYIIQIAAYKDVKQAEKEKKALEKQGYKVVSAKSGIYTVLYINEFASREAAESVVKKLKVNYNDCFIKKKQ